MGLMLHYDFDHLGRDCRCFDISTNGDRRGASLHHCTRSTRCRKGACMRNRSHKNKVMNRVSSPPTAPQLEHYAPGGGGNYHDLDLKLGKLHTSKLKHQLIRLAATSSLVP